MQVYCENAKLHEVHSLWFHTLIDSLLFNYNLISTKIIFSTGRYNSVQSLQKDLERSGHALFDCNLAVFSCKG